MLNRCGLYLDSLVLRNVEVDLLDLRTMLQLCSNVRHLEIVKASVHRRAIRLISECMKDSLQSLQIRDSRAEVGP